MMKLLHVLLSLLLVACGGGQYDQQPNPPSPPLNPPPPPGGGDLSWSQVSSALRTNCERCHAGAGFLTNEAQFLGAPSSRVQNGTMPPPSSAEAGTFQSVRNQILQYITKRKS